MLAVSALAVFTCAQILRFWTIYSLGPYWNVRIMAPDAEDAALQEPVCNGPYRFLRHPNYVVIILEFGTLPFAGGAYWTALCGSLLNAAVLFHRIRRENMWLENSPRYRRQFTAEERFLSPSPR
jgi:methyltransferase